MAILSILSFDTRHCCGKTGSHTRFANRDKCGRTDCIGYAGYDTCSKSAPFRQFVSNMTVLIRKTRGLQAESREISG